MSRASSLAIFTHFEKLTDPRIERTQAHKLLDILTIALCATICGANAWTDVERFGLAKQEWFAKFLELPGGVPSHDTFGRVFPLLDTAEFEACLRSWLRSLNKSMKGQGIAIDGKTLRHSFDQATGRAALHSVSAWAVGLRLSLGQVAIDDKSNEITAVPNLLFDAILALCAVVRREKRPITFMKKALSGLIALLDAPGATTNHNHRLLIGERGSP